MTDRWRLRGATRDAHDTVAADYHRLVGGSSDVHPDELDVVARFVDRHRGNGGGLILDVGCGTGRLLPHLAAGGEVVGIDLSPGMLAVARQEQPDAPLLVGALDALPLASGSAASAVAWYSTMYAPDDELVDAFAELGRIVAPGGLLLLGFHVGDETKHLRQAYGHAVELTSRRRSPDTVVAAGRPGGWHEVERLVRPPRADELDPQAVLVLRH
ncbi:MAG TPA: class I SAM-dependent methyltransferase [Acidimicrobiales bacterium]|nr:class I SAM-dependent methyltransferase [Acidimicrobiales bacterium]